MTWNTWAIDGDVNTAVKHPASVARMLTYAAFEGQDGIIDPTDMRVLALDVPGTSIRVMPGSAAVRNRGNGAPKEMYAVELQGSADVVPVSSTDASGGRSDLVVVRVENPPVPGEPFGLPADPTEGPYTHVRIIEDFPSDCTDYSDLEPGTYGGLMVSGTDSMLTLARIDIPASTGAITQDMLKDLRSMGQLGGRRIGENFFAEIIWTEASVVNGSSNLTSGSFVKFPANIPTWQVPIPDWATGADVICMVNPRIDGYAFGEMRMAIGNNAIAVPTTFDYDTTGVDRPVFMVSGTYVIPENVRGTVANIELQARTLQGNNATITANAGSYVYVQFAFKRNPIFV